MADNHIDNPSDENLEEEIFVASFKTLYLLAERYENDPLIQSTTAAAAALMFHYAKRLGITSMDEDELFDRTKTELAQQIAEIVKNN